MVCIQSSDLGANSKSTAIRYCVSNSLKEPLAILKKWANYLEPLRPAPSAIFEGTETAARLICESNPNFSSGGKLADQA
jgi:hypothetical protein